MADAPLVRAVRIGSTEPEGFRPLVLVIGRGEVATRWYEAPGAAAAVITVGGVGGGFDTPARGLYPALSRDLAARGIAALRVRFRIPTDLAEAEHDVLAAIEYLRTQGTERIGLVGHSFGGAVVLRVAARQEAVRCVVGLASQAYGTEPAALLGDRCPVLLIHGTQDEILPDHCSRHIAGTLTGEKHLVLVEGGRHVLDEAAEDVRATTEDWLVRHLADEQAT